MRTTLTRALVGLGLAGALFLGAGAAVAQTAGDSSSSSSTTTAQDSQSTQSSNQNGSGTAADCPERGQRPEQQRARAASSRCCRPGRRRGPGTLGRGRAASRAGRAAGQSQPRRLKMAYRVRLTTSIRARAKG